ncbi:tail assembly chaperone [Vibrio phage vB_VpaM_XM1]
MKVADPAKEVRSAALNLARSETYTSIPEWMSMPIVELSDFLSDIEEAERKAKKRQK